MATKKAKVAKKATKKTVDKPKKSAPVRVLNNGL